MTDVLGKLAAPVVWLGVLSVLLGIIAHLAPGGALFNVTANAFLKFTVVCFLFSTASGILKLAEK